MSSDKPLLVLMHGWAASSAVWSGIVDSLKHDFECLLPELPGHKGHQDDSATYEGFMRQLAERINRPAIVLGWSLGGQLAIQFASEFAEKIHRLLLVAVNPCFVQRPDWQSAMSPDVFEAFATGFNDDPHATLKRFHGLQAHGDVHRRQVVSALGNLLDLDRTLSIAWGLDYLCDKDLRQDLKALSLPISALYGCNDALVPAKVGEWMREDDLVEMTCWEGVGHAPFLSDPQGFIDWVRGSVG